MRSVARRLTLCGVGWAFAAQIVAASGLPTSADELPQPAGVKIIVTADRVEYFGDAALLVARRNVRIQVSNGVTVTGDACSIDLNLRRFVVAGHVRLTTPLASYDGAAFADFLPFHRAYFIPFAELPDRWTFLGDNWAQPEKGREMPGDVFYLADTSGKRPFIVTKRVVIDPETYMQFSPASFRLVNGELSTPPLPVYVRNFSQNPNFSVNSLSGASIDIPIGVAGSSADLDTLHARYDPVLKTYGSFEHHTVFGEEGYGVFSLNPATQPQKQWNVLAYEPTSARSALIFDGQLFTYQSGLSQPLSSNGFADLQFTQTLRQSAPRLELTQAYDSLLAPIALGYYGNPSHPFVPNHPFAAAILWPGFTQRIGGTGFSFRVLSGASEVHDIFGVSGTPLHDVQTLYLNGTFSTPVFRAPFGTSAYGSYAVQHVWLSYPNTADFQTAEITDSKYISNKFYLTGSAVLQSVATKNLAETVATPNASTGMVQEPESPNGFPSLAGVVTSLPHVTNTALALTAALAPSPNFQWTLVAQENHYTPVQEPFVGGPPRYEAIADVRTRISKTLFLDIGRAYYFNWGNQRWSPAFALQVSGQ